MKLVTLESLYRGSIFQSVRSWIPDQNRFGNDRFGNLRKVGINQEKERPARFLKPGRSGDCQYQTFWRLLLLNEYGENGYGFSRRHYA